MNILKTIKDYLFPKFRMEDVDNYLKYNYYIETVDLICKTNKLGDIVKRNLISKITYNCTHDMFIDRRAYEYFKRTLE